MTCGAEARRRPAAAPHGAPGAARAARPGGVQAAGLEPRMTCCRSPSVSGLSPAGGGDMARLRVLLNSAVLLLLGSDVFVGANRPLAPVNVSVTHLRADSATVSWDVPEGDVIIGFSISQQRQEGHVQRFIREVNTTSRSCVLWDLEEETDYIIQVQSIGLYGESQASKKVHFRTLKKSDRFSSNSSNQDDPTVQGLDKSRHLQTGEMIIIVVVLLMWAAVITLFCRQYDIIKDNDSSNNKEKAKPSSERSTPEHHSGGLLRSQV